MNLFTIDIDWAPEAIVADTIKLFENYGVRATIFATHKSAVLSGLDRSEFEIGIHPNFNTLLRGRGGDPDTILDELLELYPEAIGVRSHSLTQNGWLLNKFREKGFDYDVNHFLPYHHGIKPFQYWNGIVRIPFNWEDDYHFAHGFSFEDSKINLSDEGLNIFNFHPIHIFLNTESIDRYNAVRDKISDVEYVRNYRNKDGVKGTRDILIELLDYVHAGDATTKTLKEVCWETNELAKIKKKVQA
jgi:hypothetical protein